MDFYIIRSSETKNSEENELQHYGIKGQQWGKRNYQYEDGSLTAEGKIRYANSNKNVRGRKVNVTSNNVAEVKKGESVNSGKVVPYHLIEDLEEKAEETVPSNDEYSKIKTELEKRDWLRVYDSNLGQFINVKRSEFADYIQGLKDSGVDPEMKYVERSETDAKTPEEIKRINAEIRYWNEMLKVPKNMPSGGSEGLITKDDRQKIMDEAKRRKKEKEAEETRKKLQARTSAAGYIKNSDTVDDFLMHHGIKV